MNIKPGNKYEIIQPISMYRKGDSFSSPLGEGSIIHIGWIKDGVCGIQLERDRYQEHWRVSLNRLTEDTTKEYKRRVGLNFGQWYLEAYGNKFNPSFPEHDAEYEFEYLQWCEYDGIEPNWEGRQ